MRLRTGNSVLIDGNIYASPITSHDCVSFIESWVWKGLRGHPGQAPPTLAFPVQQAIQSLSDASRDKELHAAEARTPTHP